MEDVIAAHVVLAPDKFKGSLPATDVAAWLRAGILREQPLADVRIAPVADGGDGTLDAAVHSGFRRVDVEARGPLGDPVDAAIAVRGDTALVELAQASGLQLLAGTGLEPLTASSHGTGDLVRAALDQGCRTVILGLGGSALTDGGAGMVEALGAVLTGADGRPVAPGGGALPGLVSVDLAGLDPRVRLTTFVIASDVDNPLLGPAGAAAVYAPQKGATPADVELLEAGLTRWADAVAAAVGHDGSRAPGAGAAGGVGFAAMTMLGATSRPGLELLLEMTGFSDLLAGAGLVVTGEGSLDEQSLHGKAPVGVAQEAARHGVPAVAVAGRTTLGADVLHDAGFVATYTLEELEPDLARCIAEAGPLLERIGRRIAQTWLARVS
jgi:glycerate kinase